jgi:hypothetical protein
MRLPLADRRSPYASTPESETRIIIYSASGRRPRSLISERIERKTERAIIGSSMQRRIGIVGE